MKNLVKSMTFDNGIELRAHEKIASELDLTTYFCEPYKSFQKGAIENANRQLRKSFSRKTDISLYEQPDIATEVNKINNRPMKCLGYQTPAEVFHLEAMKENHVTTKTDEKMCQSAEC